MYGSLLMYQEDTCTLSVRNYMLGYYHTVQFHLLLPAPHIQTSHEESPFLVITHFSPPESTSRGRIKEVPGLDGQCIDTADKVGALARGRQSFIPS